MESENKESEQDCIEEKCLELIQSLFQEKRIDDTQRNNLKDMLFDEDAILISFFNKHDPGEDGEEELKLDIIKYCGGNTFGATQLEDQNTTGESIEGMSSPIDSHINSKKLRLAKMKKEQQNK